MPLLFAILAALCFGPASAAPFAVQLGDTRLALDAPPGFSDVQDTGSPRLLELAEALTSASNKILLFALEDADVRRFSLGDSPELRRYVIAVTPKGIESARVGPAGFRTLVSEALRGLGSPPSEAMELTAYLDSVPRGRPALIQALRKDPGVVSVLQGARLPDPPRSKDPPRYLLSTTTLMLVRGRALNLSVYAMHNGPEDLDWIRAATLRWIDDLQRLNNR